MKENHFPKKENTTKNYLQSKEIPLVSIIILNYNHEKLLEKAIDSALQQIYPRKEIIVVDDGSTDNSHHIIAGYGGKIKTVFQENKGSASGWNAGLFASEGEIIFFLDADDVFLPHKIEKMVNFFLQVLPNHSDVMIFHRLEMVTLDGIKLGFKPKRVRNLQGKQKKGQLEMISQPDEVYRYLQKWGFLPFRSAPTSGLALTRSLADKFFPLPSVRRFPDSFLLFGAMVLGFVYGTPCVLGRYVLHGKNVTLTQITILKDVIEVRDAFLNDLLQRNNKEPIVSFLDSRFARRPYELFGTITDLLRLVYQVPARFLCWETLRFSFRTLFACLRATLGFQKQHLRKQRVFEKATKEREKTL